MIRPARSVFLASAARFVQISIAVPVNLIRVPLGLHYFGVERFGVWLVVWSALSYIRLMDNGFAGALRTLLPSAESKDGSRRILWTFFVGFMVVALLLIALLALSFRIHPGWPNIFFKLRSPSLVVEAAMATAVVMASYLLYMPFRVFSVAFAGLQRAYVEEFYNTSMRVLSLVALVLTVVFEGSLVHLALATGGMLLLQGVISCIHLIRAYRWLTPGLRLWRIPVEEGLLSKASGVVLKFTVLGAASVLTRQTDNLVIGAFLGANSVPAYAVTFLFYELLRLMITSYQSSLWPLYAKLIHAGEWKTVARYYNFFTDFSMLLGGLVLLIGLGFGGQIITVWSGSQAYGGDGVSWALAGYLLISVFFASNASLIHGANPPSSHVAMLIAEGVLNLVLSIWLVNITGILGVALATLIARTLTQTWWGPWLVYRLSGGQVKLRVRSWLMPAILLVSALVLWQFKGQGVLTRLMVTTACITVFLVFSYRFVFSNNQFGFKDAMSIILKRERM